MTDITGDEYFPGGLGEFVAKKNEFLVFEEGPSQDVVLQWATYRDASDQTSLSRIWGGIHPPADDIPGRLIGQEVAEETFNFAIPYFTGSLSVDEFDSQNQKVYPNPTTNKELFISNANVSDTVDFYDIRGREIKLKRSFNTSNNTINLKFNSAETGLYLLKVNGKSQIIVVKD